MISAYLHDVADILLYLLIPAEDFRTRPFRFLIREVLVKRILLPVLDLFSDPDYINYIIVWLVRFSRRLNFSYDRLFCS